MLIKFPQYYRPGHFLEDMATVLLVVIVLLIVGTVIEKIKRNKK